jgi:ribonuclease HII
MKGETGDISPGADSDIIVAGVDEAGRGPLAGPVVAAAVVLSASQPIDGLADSKTLSAPRRDALACQIRAQATTWALGMASVEEIDQINILQATLLAMQRAVQSLGMKPGLVLVDGNRAPKLSCAVRTVVRGDALIQSISAASILAKVARDAILRDLDVVYPGYGFAIHKGYPTAAHQRALQELGPSAVHRRSFAPIRRLLDRN